MMIAPLIKELSDLENSGVSMSIVEEIILSEETFNQYRNCSLSRQYIDYHNMTLFGTFPFEIHERPEKPYEIILMVRQ